MSEPTKTDRQLAEALDKAFARLGKYYPEHKVIGLDALDSKLRERFAQLYRQAGYATVEELFASRGFVKISGSQVRELRDSVLYQDAYLSYLQNNAERAIQIVVEFNDLAGLSILAELGVFTGENIDQVVELANASKKPEIVGYLMNYKNASIGFTETNYEL